LEKAGGRLKGRVARGDIPVKNEERSSERGFQTTFWLI
jgi:hypothetical protein